MPRRPLDTEVADLAQAIGLLVRRVRAESGAHELSLTESAVLARLEREGPATTADLARAERMRPQSMGTTIATLEELGCIARKPHPTDGRQVHIELTAKGAALRQGAREAKRSWLARAITTLDDAERDTLFAAGRIVRRLADSE
jgi:DNA-binding MarR family transcriptional regulator